MKIRIPLIRDSSGREFHSEITEGKTEFEYRLVVVMVWYLIS